MFVTSEKTEKSSSGQSPFIFVGGHPAIDFANTYCKPTGEEWEDLFHNWNEVLAWLSIAGVSKDPRLKLSGVAAERALGKVAELRARWKEELARVVADGQVNFDWIALLNRLLEEDLFSETLRMDGRADFRFERSASRFGGEKLALCLFARQIAEFLATANLKYVSRCANTETCVLYFYDTTKNHRRQWCSAALCGNRHKVAAHRARQARKRKGAGDIRN